MGLAEVAMELLYTRSVLADLGHSFHSTIEMETADPEARRRASIAQELVQGPTEIGTDNSGAYDLCHRTTRGKHSRHIERRYFKIREMRRAGHITLRLVPTKEMEADMLTKPLDDATFARHRATTMNLSSHA